jgi:hypothetical protein
MVSSFSSLDGEPKDYPIMKTTDKKFFIHDQTKRRFNIIADLVEYFHNTRGNGENTLPFFEV